MGFFGILGFLGGPGSDFGANSGFFGYLGVPQAVAQEDEEPGDGFGCPRGVFGVIFWVFQQLAASPCCGKLHLEMTNSKKAVLCWARALPCTGCSL